MFCAEFKYVVRFFHPYQARFLSDARMKFEENLYLHYTTGSIYITYKVRVNDFLLYVTCGTSLISVQK